MSKNIEDYVTNNSSNHTLGGNKGTPHLCMLCKGKGEITQAKAKHDAIPIHSSIKNGKTRKIFACHICNGEGVLWSNNQPFMNVAPYQPGITPIPTIGGTDTIMWTTNQPVITDHICSSVSTPKKLCNYCVETKRYPGAGCSCSPEGYPHSENCKGWPRIHGDPNNISYEELKDENDCR